MLFATGGARVVTNAAGTTGVQLPAGGTAWAALSDRGLKENVRPVDGQEILRRLSEVPITEWNLVSQPATIRHLGPMAQDFHAAFGLRESDRYITSSDADGVALAAIQALYRMALALERKTAALEEKTAEMAEKTRGLERTQQALEAQGMLVRELNRRLGALEPRFPARQ